MSAELVEAQRAEIDALTLALSRSGDQLRESRARAAELVREQRRYGEQVSYLRVALGISTESVDEVVEAATTRLQEHQKAAEKLAAALDMPDATLAELLQAVHEALAAVQTEPTAEAPPANPEPATDPTFNPAATCGNCGAEGAHDVLGDLLCDTCCEALVAEFET